MYQIELNPTGEVWLNESGFAHRVDDDNDMIQDAVKRYCAQWECVNAKEKGLPLAAVLRGCAEEIERRLKR